METHSITTSKKSSNFQKNMFSIVENTRKLSEYYASLTQFSSFLFQNFPFAEFFLSFSPFSCLFFSSSSTSFLPCQSPVTFCLYLFCLLLLPFLYMLTSVSCLSACYRSYLSIFCRSNMFFCCILSPVCRLVSNFICPFSNALLFFYVSLSPSSLLVCLFICLLSIASFICLPVWLIFVYLSVPCLSASLPVYLSPICLFVFLFICVSSLSCVGFLSPAFFLVLSVYQSPVCLSVSFSLSILLTSPQYPASPPPRLCDTMRREL
jgi:hypothetical protein